MAPPFGEGSVAALLMILSVILSIICIKGWLGIRAFKVRWWWGLIVVFLPLGEIPFTIFNWSRAKLPFVVALGLLFFPYIILLVGWTVRTLL